MNATLVQMYVTKLLIESQGFGGVHPHLARAPYGIKGAELGAAAIFIGLANMRNVGGVKYQRWMAQFRKKEARFTCGLAFCFLTTTLTTVANCISERGPL